MILILGFPRSGTTWLAKIFDSHPEVLYRHEPDELLQPTTDSDPLVQIREWIRQRSLRSAAKRPVFRKSWRPLPLAALRVGMAAALAAADRLPGPPIIPDSLALPDFIGKARRDTVRAAIKLVAWDGSAAARAIPGSRCCLIIRHPCGQIASIKTGVASGLFQPRSGMRPLIDYESTAAFAARHGVAPHAFDQLSDVAKFAWTWRAFNEPAAEALEHLPNARIVIYEDLCHAPEAVAQDLFAFAGLRWNGQTEGFIKASARSDRNSGYYDVFRSASAVAEQWRKTMSEADQATVCQVVRSSPLARYWPDLRPPA